MPPDLEIVEKARSELSHPVSEQESRARRLQILRRTAGTLAAVGVYVALVRIFEPRRAMGAESLGIWVLLIAWFVARDLRAARPRPATPVPQDILSLKVREYRRCRSCRAIIKTLAPYCPACGTGSVSPTFVLVSLGSAVALIVWLWWLIL